MSASREKKIRQEQTASGAKNEKAVKAAQEAAKQRRSNILYTVIAVVFVLVAAVSWLLSSGVLQRNAAAMELDGRKYTAAEVSYYYRNAVTSVRSSAYASYYGLDSTAPYDEQQISDTAKMLLGLSDDSIVTWEDYFQYTAKQLMVRTYALEKAGKEAGFAFDETQQAEFDATMDSLKSYAVSSGYPVKSYIRVVYGNYMTMNTLKELLRSDIYAEYYSNSYADGLTYSDADLQAYYESDRECFDVADYEYLYISGAAEPAVDADGNAAEATDAEIAAAAQAAKDCLADAEERAANGEALEDIAASYDDDALISYRHVTNQVSNASELSQWVFAEGRADGDITTIDTTVDGGTPTYYVALFHSAGRPEYNTVSVRHILIQPDSSNADADAAKADARAQAEDILRQWKNGAASEEFFAELAGLYSSDGGSQNNGGLYENIQQGDMVQPFNDWCFDASRKAGDTGIVETDYGYHVMYFSAAGDVAWKTQVRDEMKAADVNDYIGSLTEGLEPVVLSGMKYVG